MKRKKGNHDVSALFNALIPRVDNATKRQMLSLIFLVTATILEYIRGLSTVLIPRMQDATKRQMLSLFSALAATTIITTPLASADPGSPVLIIVKTASPTTYSDVGQNVTYTYNVTNTGNVPITGVITVTDDHINGGIPFNISTEGLAVNASVNGTANYTITLTDVTNGSVTNFANATTTYLNQTITSDTVNATVQYTHLKIVKTASPTTYDTVGQNVTYTYNVTNDGNVTLTGPITVTDDRINGGIPFNISTEGLAVNGSVIGTANYTINQADITNGSVTNFANAIASYNNTTVNSTTENATVLYSHLKIVKTASPTTYDTVGQNVTYTYNVTNDGNVTLTGPITVTDDHINGGVPFNISTEGLDVGESVNGTATYPVTQADINAGSVTNNATATGSLNGANINSTVTNATVTAIQNPGLNLEKSASPTTYDTVGQNVTYTYNVTNVGNVDITGPITVTDDHINGGVPFNISTEGLDVDENINGTATYTITQADINAGSVTNNATATGSFNGSNINSTVTNATVTAIQNPGLTLEKSASPLAYDTVGQNVTYTYNVTNVGNVDITGPITVTDDHINGGVPFNISTEGLDVDENINGTATYTITQADINAGSLTNNATATGSFNGSNINSTIANATVTAIQNPLLTLTKSSYPETFERAGQVITYIYNVTNIGNVPVSGPITITDDKIGTFDISSADLAPGESVNGTADYTITHDDINAGSVTNAANVTSTFDGDVIDSGSVTKTVIPERSEDFNPHYTIAKSVIDPDPTGDCIINAPGDKIPYRIVVNNDGNVNLTNVTVEDSLISLEGPTGDDNDKGVLNPGETWVFNGVYTLTQDDIDNGDYIDNIATVTSDQLPDESSIVSQPIDKSTDLSIQKAFIGIDDSGDFTLNGLGDVINYQIVVKNNGNINANNVVVTDSLIDLSEPTGDNTDPGVLNPGEYWVYTGDYTVTQEDIESIDESGVGFIENTATATCDELLGDTKTSSIVVPIFRTPYVDPLGGSKPTADFSTDVTNGYAPLSVQFTDKSTGTPTSWSWDFNGDDIADSSTQSPAYTYTTPGTYTVKLTVSNAYGSDSKTTTITVQQTSGSSSGGSGGGSSGGSSGGSIGTATVVGSGQTDGTGTANVLQPENNTSNIEQISTSNVEPTPKQNNTTTPVKQTKRTPGFEIIFGITALFGAVYLCRRR